ncbi:MAG TPA: serine/threonine-protein kinase, partial [Nakamurella sp.]
GMGVVWEGRDELLGRRVAVKQVLLQPGLSEAEALLARNRVIREARITARLHHPHAVTIYDVVDDGDYPCLIMQFVPSNSLNGLLLDRGTLPTPEVGRIGADLAAALQAAHQVGIVHRDVKPGNVLITDDGSAKLTDFGISHATGDVTLTSTGMVSGTPAYLAPEVARGGTSGFAADVFSLGATMYASLEGTPPFGLEPNPMAVLYRVATGQIIPPRRSGSLTPLLLHMMAPEPADRPTMAEVSRTLSPPTIESPPPAARPMAPLRPPAQDVSVRTLPVSRPDLTAAKLTTSEPGIAEPTSVRTAALAEPMNSTHTKVPEPADTPADTPRRRRSLTAVVAVAAVALATALVTGYLLFIGGDGGQGTANTAAQNQAAAASASQGPSTAAVTDQPLESQVAQSTAASASDPAVELAAAVTDYYALMPANTEAGWARLTPGFQSGIAQNRAYYNSFWGGINRVVASEVTGTAPDTVEATITYYFTGGNVSVERTAYRLVQDGGEWKIDSSSVLSSRVG